jgi:hypothetical protein
MTSDGATERCIGKGSDSTEVEAYVPVWRTSPRHPGVRDLRWQRLDLNRRRMASANDRCVPKVDMIRFCDCGSSGYPTDVRK